MLKLPTMNLFLTLILILAVPVSGWAGDLKCDVLPRIMQKFTLAHYSKNRVSSVIMDQTVEQFIQQLDSSKTMLLASDIPKLKEDVRSTFKTFYKGNCKKLTDISALMVTRAKENEDFFRKFLDKDYKLDESVELILDPKKREYPADLKAKQAVLANIGHFQISNSLLGDVKLDEAKKQLIHRYELVTKRMQEKKPEDMLEHFLQAFALALDPHSSYLSKDEMEDFRIQMQLSLEGIGASLSSQNGFTVIEELIPGGGAEKVEKLQPKDKIIAVAEGKKGKPVSVIDMDLRDVVQLIRGKKGTLVRLTILRKAETTETFDVEIIRDKIDIKDRAAQIHYKELKQPTGRTLKLGVVELPSFYGGGGSGTRSSSVDMRKLLLEARNEKVDGILLDLTRNGGGLLDEAVRIAGLFFKSGGVVATRDGRGRIEVLADDDKATLFSKPMVVLTGRLSASASEIVAGAMKDYKRALIVGADHTFGKGSVQVFSGLRSGLGAMKVTTGLYFLPGGQSTQNQGVTAHIDLPSVLSSEDIGEKSLDYPLKSERIKGFVSKSANDAEPKYHWLPITNAVVKKLSAKSKKRVKEAKKFDEVRESIVKREKNEDTVKLAELRKDSKESKEKEDKKEKGKKKDKKRDKEQEIKDYLENVYIEEGLNVLADLVTIQSSEVSVTTK